MSKHPTRVCHIEEALLGDEHTHSYSLTAELPFLKMVVEGVASGLKNLPFFRLAFMSRRNGVGNLTNCACVEYELIEERGC